MMTYDFQAIRRDYPLESIVSKSVVLKRANNNQIGCCPFHPDKSPSFVVYADQSYHCFGCNAHGDVIDFVANKEHLSTSDAIAYLTGGNAPELTSEDRAALKREQAHADAKRKVNEENATQSARARWAKAHPVNGAGNGYLTRKDIAPYGTRIEGDWLLVPVLNRAGLLQSVQAIPPASGDKKLFHAGAPARGGSFSIGDATSGPILICEGFATGATLQAASGYLVVIAFSKTNMRAVIEGVKADFPARDLIICPDTDGIEGAHKIAADLGCKVIVPDMQGAEGSDFNDQAAHYGLDDVAALFAAPVEQEPRAIRASSFVVRSEAAIPKREWLYGRHLLRKFVSVDVAAGGVGKSSLKIGEALAMASGRDLYGSAIHEGPYNVWLYNLEDPIEETERRIHATAKHFKIDLNEIADRLYVDSGRDQRLILAEETAGGVKINRPVREAILAEIREKKIDVMTVDPFVSSHAVSENDNMAIDLVTKEWASIADEANCSINLVHHVRKSNGEAASADSARGASSLIGAARSVMVFNRMTKDEAAGIGIEVDQVRFFFRVDNDKANLAPPEGASWYRMNNVDLENGDSVGVACPFELPDLFTGISVRQTHEMQRLVGAGDWRENVQTRHKWVGYPIAEALGMDIDKDKKRIAKMLRAWLAEGVLEIVEKDDEQRRPRQFVIVGKWVEV